MKGRSTVKREYQVVSITSTLEGVFGVRCTAEMRSTINHLLQIIHQLSKDCLVSSDSSAAQLLQDWNNQVAVPSQRQQGSQQQILGHRKALAAAGKQVQANASNNGGKAYCDVVLGRTRSKCFKVSTRQKGLPSNLALQWSSSRSSF